MIYFESWFKETQSIMTGEALYLGLCISYFFVAMINCHNQSSSNKEESILLYGSRGVRVHHGG